MIQPNVKVIVGKLKDILSGKLSREDVADWAMKYIEDDEVRIIDFKAWELLKQVGGIDLPESPEIYLYTEEDIRKWISDSSN